MKNNAWCDPRYGNAYITDNPKHESADTKLMKKIKEKHVIKMEQNGVMNVICVNSSQKFFNQVVEKCGRRFNYHHLTT